MTPFTTILADPPWSFSDGLTMSSVKRGAASNYPTMTVDQICDLYQSSQVQHVLRGQRGGYQKRPGTLAGHPIADTAFLALWVTKDVLLDGVGVRVMNAWGFTPKQIVPWVKGRIRPVPSRDGCHNLPDPQLVLQMGMGRIFRNCVEYLLIGTRGKYSTLIKDKGVNGLILDDEVILAERGRHSAKPAVVHSIIERTLPGPYLELFARERRDGWTSWGNEVGCAGRPLNTTEPELPLEPMTVADRRDDVQPEPPIEWS